MPSKRGHGDYSRGALKALEWAVGVQGIALDSIRDQFAASTGLDLTRGVSYEEFIKALTEAHEAGQSEAFEAHLAEQMGNAWTTFQQQQQAAAAAQQGAPPEQTGQ